MNEAERASIIDTLKTPGWKLIEAQNLTQAASFRRLATQQPGAVSEQLRTWYSALAEGIELAMKNPVDKVVVEQEE